MTLTPYRTTRRVEFRDTDAAGIVHFSVFFTWMEEAEHELLRQLGLSVASEDDQGAIGWPRVTATCDYTSAVRFEEELEIEIQLEKLSSKSATYTAQFTHQGRSVAKGQMTSVCCRLNEQGTPVSIAIPEPIREKLQSLLPRNGT